MCVCVRVRVLVDSYLCECADVCFAGPQIDLFFFLLMVQLFLSCGWKVKDHSIILFMSEASK